MKSDEDEAFDDIARRQGGGGYQAKRQAAMDKINSEFDEEYKKMHEDRAKYGTSWSKDGERIDPRSVYLEEPAQKPPKYAMRAYWEDDGRIGVVATVERPDGGFHLLGAIIDPPPAKEKAE